MNDDEKIFLSKELKLKLLKILKNGFITKREVEELNKMSGTPSIIIEIIDKTEDVRNENINFKN